MVMADWKDFQRRFNPRVTFPGKVDGRLLSDRMTDAADKTNRVMLFFAGKVRELEAVKGPIHYQSLMGGALLGFLAGVVLALMVAQ